MFLYLNFVVHEVLGLHVFYRHTDVKTSGEEVCAFVEEDDDHTDNGEKRSSHVHMHVQNESENELLSTAFESMKRDFLHSRRSTNDPPLNPDDPTAYTKVLIVNDFAHANREGSAADAGT